MNQIKTTEVQYITDPTLQYHSLMIGLNKNVL